ncbi:MAG: glycosyltransferase family 4 protein [Verrucomicrobiaceae bacterium]|nr:glycosyltransferase family 4 protein [Verrucomicrobiaceae bacterium]
MSSLSPIHVYFTTELFLPDLPGGLMRLWRYGPGLQARGIQMHIVTVRHKPELALREQIEGFDVHRFDLPEGAGADYRRIWLLKQAYALARDQSGSVLQPNMLVHTLAPTLWSARTRGIGTVFNVSIAPESPMPTALLARSRQKLRMAWMCSPLDRIVFLGHELKRVYQQRWPMRSKQVQVIPNGVDLDRFRPVADSEEKLRLRDAMGLPQNVPVALFVSGVMPRKGLDVVLRSWERVLQWHPDAVLAVVGSRGIRASHASSHLGITDALQSHLDEVAELQSRLTRPDSIRFLGEMEDPAQAYRCADVFVFPSRREGLPNVVLEAMASGLPCLVARFEGMPADGEAFGHSGVHFRSMSHEPDEWAAALIEWLGAGPQTRQKIGDAARVWIEQTNNLSTVLDDWAQLYRSVASPSS